MRQWKLTNDSAGGKYQVNTCRRCIIPLSVSLILTANPVRAALQFIGIGTMGAGGNTHETKVSANGAAATGWADGLAGQQAFHWQSATGLQGLGFLSQQVKGSLGFAISGDGSVVAGSSHTDAGSTAFRWTQVTGLQSLGDLAGGRVESVAYGISGDGNIIVGRGYNASGYRGFKWTASTGMVALALLSGDNYNEAFAISLDGTVIAGVTGSGSGPDLELQAALWRPSGLLGLGDLPGGSIYAEAHAVSRNGAVASGWSSSLYGVEAFRWSAETGMTGLGDLPGGSYHSRALAVSGDGNKIAGFATTAAGKEAFLWDEVSGMQRLRDVLEAEGMELPGWTLLEASGFSDDGDVIAGTGINPSGQWESFLISGFNSIPEPGTAGLLLLLPVWLLTARQKCARQGGAA